MKFLTVLSSWGVLLQKIANHMQNSTIPREHFQQCSSDRKNAFYAQAKIIKFLFADQQAPGFVVNDAHCPCANVGFFAVVKSL